VGKEHGGCANGCGGEEGSEVCFHKKKRSEDWIGMVRFSQRKRKPKPGIENFRSGGRVSERHGKGLPWLQFANFSSGGFGFSGFENRG
jgi:hypothetical protein